MVKQIDPKIRPFPDGGLKPAFVNIVDAKWKMSISRILIVDDHPAMRRSLLCLFEALPEFSVCGEAENGEQAIEKAQQLTPDVIILDISMPVLNGIEAAKRLRSISPGVRILMFTSFVHPQLSEIALAAGANMVIAKSSLPTEFIRTLKELLKPAA